MRPPRVENPRAEELEILSILLLMAEGAAWWRSNRPRMISPGEPLSPPSSWEAEAIARGLFSSRYPIFNINIGPQGETPGGDISFSAWAVQKKGWRSPDHAFFARTIGFPQQTSIPAPASWTRTTLPQTSHR